MNSKNPVLEAEVFAFQKTLVGGALLSCYVSKRPSPNIGMYSYRFTLILSEQDYNDTAALDDVTGSPEVAEELFNRLCTGNVLPCHLNDVAYDLLAEL